MTAEEFKKDLLELAIKAGCDAAEVYIAENDDFSVSVLDGKIDKYESSSGAMLTLRVVYGGHDGFASANVFDGAQELVDAAIDNARVISTTDSHPMQDKSQYESVYTEKSHITDLTERECIDLALDMERRALARDSRVRRVMGCGVHRSRGGKTLENTLGLCAGHQSEMGFIEIGVVMEDAGETQYGSAYRFGAETTDTDGMTDEAISECAEKFGASPVPVGEYRVLFTNKCFADMLDLYQSAFSADAAQMGLSPLAGKEGTCIAAECVNICENPFLAKYPIPFDGEGVPARRKNVVERGVLTTLLHSLKTAKKAGCVTTGNGTRTGSCATANMFLQNGEASFTDLVQGERVIVLSEVDGAGAGVDTVSGAFSLSAKGQLYENGERVRAVNQITVAGNFYELLKDIIAVGNDLRFIFPYAGGMGLIGSPCVLVDKLHIAG